MLTAAVLVSPAPALPPPERFWEQKGCRTHYTSRRAREGLRDALKHTRPDVDKRHVQTLWRCQATRPKAHAAHRYAHALWGWRHREPQRSWIRVHRSPMPYCTWGPESGGSYTAVNSSSGAYGKYQVMPLHWAGGICSDLGRDPLGQELCARRIYATSGAGAWVGC